MMNGRSMFAMLGGTLMLAILLLVGCANDTVTQSTPRCLNDAECPNELFCHPTQHVCVSETDYMDARPPAVPDPVIDMGKPSQDPVDMLVSVDVSLPQSDSSIEPDAQTNHPDSGMMDAIAPVKTDMEVLRPDDVGPPDASPSIDSALTDAGPLVTDMATLPSDGSLQDAELADALGQ